MFILISFYKNNEKRLIFKIIKIPNDTLCSDIFSRRSLIIIKKKKKEKEEGKLSRYL